MKAFWCVNSRAFFMVFGLFQGLFHSFTHTHTGGGKLVFDAHDMWTRGASDGTINPADGEPKWYCARCTEMKGPCLGSLWVIWAHLMLWTEFMGPRRQWNKYLSYPEGYEHQWVLIRPQLCLFVSAGLYAFFIHHSFSVQLSILCLFVLCVHIFSEPTFLSSSVCMSVCVTSQRCVCSLIFKEVTMWISLTPYLSRHQTYPPPLFVLAVLTKQLHEITH